MENFNLKELLADFVKEKINYLDSQSTTTSEEKIKEIIEKCLFLTINLDRDDYNSLTDYEKETNQQAINTYAKNLDPKDFKTSLVIYVDARIDYLNEKNDAEFQLKKAELRCFSGALELEREEYYLLTVIEQKIAKHFLENFSKNIKKEALKKSF